MCQGRVGLPCCMFGGAKNSNISVSSSDGILSLILKLQFWYETEKNGHESQATPY